MDKQGEELRNQVVEALASVKQMMNVEDNNATPRAESQAAVIEDVSKSTLEEQAETSSEDAVAVVKDVENVDDRENSLEYWKQRCKVLIGKENSEVPRLSKELRDVKEENVGLLKKLESIESQLSEVKNNTVLVKSEDQKNSLLTRLKEILGDDAADLVAGLVESGIRSAPNAIEGKLSEIEKKINASDQRQQSSARQIYNRELNKIPNISALTMDDKWKAWLSNKVPFSNGQRFGDILAQADKDMDIDRVKEIFDNYSLQTKTKNSNKTLDIEELIQPKKVNSKPNVQDKEKQFYSKKDIDQLTSDYLSGKYHGRESEYQKKSIEYQHAIRDGRVRSS